jgi:hypothetical protein
MATSPVSVSEPENTALLRTGAIGRTTSPSVIGPMAPVSGAIFCLQPAAVFYHHLRQIGRGDIRTHYPVASWHIAYNNTFHSVRIKQERFGRWGRAVQRDSQGDGAEGADDLARRFLYSTTPPLAERSGCRTRRSLLQFEFEIVASTEPLRCGGLECENARMGGRDE